MSYTIMDEKRPAPADDLPTPTETNDVELEAANDRINELESELAEYGDAIIVETGMGNVTLATNNIRLTHELEAFAEALAAKYGGQVL